MILHDFMRCGAVALSFGIVILDAHGGRPMIVDDASIRDPKTCQLETWIQKNRDGTEYWTVPACNFSGNLEVAFGGARITGTERSSTLAVMQGKTLFKKIDPNGWGAGLVFGNQFNPEHSVLGDLYAEIQEGTISVSQQLHGRNAAGDPFSTDGAAVILSIPVHDATIQRSAPSARPSATTCSLA